MDSTNHNIFSGARGTLCITDPQGTIVFVNQTIEQRLGYSVAEAVGRRPGQLWGGHANRSRYQYLWNEIRAGKPAVIEVVNKHKQGGENGESIHVAPLLDRQKHVRYFFELHPHASVDIQKFRQEFLSFFSQDYNLTQLLAFFSQALGKKVETNSTYSNLSDFFVEECIVPMQETFSNRYDDELLLLQAKQHPSLFAELYNKYYYPILAYFLKRLPTESVAEDLTQETFTRAFVRIRDFELRNANYFTYLSRIAHNLLVNYYRKKQRTEALSEHVDGLFSDKQYQVFKKLFLEAGLSILSYTEQQVVKMKYKDRASVKEIADELGKTENAVKLHLSRARKKLREYFK